MHIIIKICFFLLLLSVANLSDSKIKPKYSISHISPSPKVLSKVNQLRENVKVTRVIDGDTIEIEGGLILRYIGMDAPEQGQNCYLESKNRNKELVEGKVVNLEKDISETDKYRRLLRYVYVDNVLINELLVKEGFAKVATYPPDVKHQNRFLAAQAEQNSKSTSNCLM